MFPTSPTHTHTHPWHRATVAHGALVVVKHRARSFNFFLKKERASREVLAESNN